MSATMNAVRGLTAIATLVAVLALVAGGAQAALGNPDLAVTKVSTSPAPEPGENVEVSATVENQGDQDSNNFTYGFSIDGESLGSEQEHGQGVPAGESVTITAPVQWSVDAGEHAINASVDHWDTSLSETETKDTNGDNDQRQRQYKVGPDLRINSFEVRPSEAVEGDEITFEATIENVAKPEESSPNADKSFEVAFPVDGQSRVAPVNVGGLAAGETATVSATWTATEGQHTVTATVDPDQAIADRDRSNNAAGGRSLDVRPALPDLVVSGLSFSPDPASTDEPVTFTPTLSNNGRADAGEHNVSLVVDGETVDTTTVSGVAQGAAKETSLSWTAEAGTHDIEVHVDAGETVKETNEGNNAWTLQLPVGPDFVVRDFEIQPPDPRANDRVRFTAEIGNDGQAVNDTFPVAFAVDGTPIDSVEVTSLKAGEVRNVTSAVWNATTGDHNVSVTVDPEDAIGETDRKNNQHYASVTVGEPRPDVAILSASLDPVTPDAGEEATVRAKIENAGARDADAFTVTATVDGDAIGEVRVDGLASGAQKTIALGNWTAENGSHELVVEADLDDAITEGSEDNNRFVRSLGIGSDLALLELSLTPQEPEAGDNVTALALVQNNGSVATPATNVSLRLDGAEIGTRALDGLGPNQQGSAEFTFTAAASATLEARVDPTEAIDEFDEDNNLAQADLQLANEGEPPDLTVRSVSVEGDPESDEGVRFTAEIANVGGGRSPGALVDFRVDGTSIDSPVSVEGLEAGQTAEVTSVNWTPTQNEHELEVHVDPEDRLAEADETNNTFKRSVEGSAVAIPLTPGSGALSLLAAALALASSGGRKRKPP